MQPKIQKTLKNLNFHFGAPDGEKVRTMSAFVQNVMQSTDDPSVDSYHDLVISIAA